MRRDGLTPNTITYTALLASCRSQPSLVPPLLQRLRREKGLANTIVLTSAISTLVHGDAHCRRKLESSVCACKFLRFLRTPSFRTNPGEQAHATTPPLQLRPCHSFAFLLLPCSAVM
jgi:hypothetical protein